LSARAGIVGRPGGRRYRHRGDLHQLPATAVMAGRRSRGGSEPHPGHPSQRRDQGERGGGPGPAKPCTAVRFRPPPPD